VSPEAYISGFVEPTVKDLVANPASQRHAFIACLVTFHLIDYLTGRKSRAILRAEFRRQSPAFAAIDRLAHAHKPVQSGEKGAHSRAEDGSNRVMSAAEVPSDARDATLVGEQADIVALVNEAASFLRNKIREEAAPSEEPVAATYYVVVPFDRNADGYIVPGAAQETISAGAAQSRARTLANEHEGALAFSRRGDRVTGEFEDAVILARFGEVDLDALTR